MRFHDSFSMGNFIFRYKALNNRETDRHRLIMCHCHFLYDCILYNLFTHHILATLTINQLFFFKYNNECRLIIHLKPKLYPYFLDAMFSDL